MNKQTIEGLEKAIELCGSMTALAELLEERVSTVGSWRARGRIAPRKILDIVRLVDGQVKPYQLDSELYPDPRWLPPGVPKKKRKKS